MLEHYIAPELRLVSHWKILLHQTKQDAGPELGGGSLVGRRQDHRIELLHVKPALPMPAVMCCYDHVNLDIKTATSQVQWGCDCARI